MPAAVLPLGATFAIAAIMMLANLTAGVVLIQNYKMVLVAVVVALHALLVALDVLAENKEAAFVAGVAAATYLVLLVVAAS